MNFNFSDDKQLNRQLHNFAQQIALWYNDGKTPKLASQDTRFTLELQKQKLRSLGLEMQIQIRKPESSHHDVGAITYGDSVFVNSIIGSRKHFTTTIRDAQKEIYNSDAEGGLTLVMQEPKQGGVPSPATAMCCPNCGAPSTLGRLESGCESCNTKFLMDELYPKVMHFFIEEDGKKIFDTKEITKYALVCTGLALVLFIVSTLVKAFTGNFQGTDVRPRNSWDL